MKYIMALDQGTTSSRCILFDHSGKICSVVQKEFTQIYPHPGWVEHDAQEIWDTTLEVARTAMLKLKVPASDIAGIGITNQRETTVVWDKNTGEPVYNAVVWQCRRTSGMVDKLIEDGWGDRIRAKTGLVPDAYFSGTKIRWILDNVPGARARAEAGELLFGTIDTWLIWKLTGGANDRLSEGLHEALGRYHASGSVCEEDRRLAGEVLRGYASLRAETDVMRCKLCALLLPTYKLSGDEEAFVRLHDTMRGLLPVVKAPQSRALLLVTLYGCTDNALYRRMAHELVDPWQVDPSPKKSKLSLIRRLGDYDRWLGHESVDS